MADLATLRVVVDASGAIRAVDQFGKTVAGATEKVNRLNDSAKRVGLMLGTTLVAGLALVIRETSEAEKVQAQLGAALRSTGGAAGQTIGSLNDHAAALQMLTAFSDEAIGSAQALLLTFTNIRGDVFPQATLAVLNLATALQTDLKGAAIQVGKALNDPILGVTALGRAGVQFSPAQKAMIAGFIETNQLAKAQGVILAELATQTEHSAAAYRNTLPGALTAVKNAFTDLFEVGSPGMDGLVDSANDFADTLTLLPTRIALVLEHLKNVKLQFSSFFDFGGTDANTMLDRLEAEASGRPAPPPRKTPEQELAGSTNDIANLDRLLREQMAAIAAARLAREVAREGRGRGPGPPPFPDEPTITAVAMAATKFDAALKALGDTLKIIKDNLDSQVKALGKAIDFDAGVNAKRDRSLKNLKEGVDELSESSRVFLEQTQIALGQFFSDFLKDGFTSVRSFFQQFAQLGRDAIGNLFAKQVMDAVGTRFKDALSGAFSGLGGGIFGGVLATFVSGITGATNALDKMVAATNRAIADFARRPLDAQLTDEQRQLRDLTAERDALVRRALGDRGLGGLEGSSFEDTRSRAAQQLANVRELMRRNGLGQIDLIKGASPQERALEKSLLAFLDQLGAIGNAFDANTETIRKNILVLENQRRAEQSATLARFRDSLSLGAQSPLSPTAQLAEARRQYDVILALAKSGDQSAIASLPETARTLLDASRAVNASGARYAQDFAKVNADVTGLVTSIGNQIIDVRDEILDRVDPYFSEAISIADASLAAQQTGFKSVVDGLEVVRAEISAMKQALKLSLDEVATAVS